MRLVSLYRTNTRREEFVLICHLDLPCYEFDGHVSVYYISGHYWAPGSVTSGPTRQGPERAVFPHPVIDCTRLRASFTVTRLKPHWLFPSVRFAPDDPNQYVLREFPLRTTYSREPFALWLLSQPPVTISRGTPYQL